MGMIIIWDFILSFTWPWAGSLVKLFVHSFLRFENTSEAQVLRYSLSVVYMYLFAFLRKLTRGGAYNPLTILDLSHGIRGILFVAFARIPTQIAGSIVGVLLIKKNFPEVGHGPKLNVDIHHGAIIEGILTFVIVLFNLTLNKANPKSFVMRTWISTICKMSIHLLGADLTGGIMNPASAVGWAYARGDHITKEHILVYWLAPLQATILALWTFSLLNRPKKSEGQMAEDQKVKSE